MTDSAETQAGLSLVQKIIAASTVLLILGVTTIAGIIIVERKDRRATAKPQQIRVVAAARAETAEEAEASATWETYHCKLLHRYYIGPERELPIAELLGLPPQADETEVEKRCNALLPAVHRMGGWPSENPAQDNFVVCRGFEWIIDFEGNEIRIRPDPDVRSSNAVLYSLNRGAFQKQSLNGIAPSSIGGLTTPMVTRADDRCVIVSAQRSGRRRGIPGAITRTDS
ncbi:MAG: hypothetical protein OQJ99_04010 [Rhodospirillales bacterium]|nr:hypothetical protein [Rhodospirillales bacterium]MCW8970726.1 hypothetical protein [Rhodospirillales bacterium]MCW9003301.1 hypothetical protein [Rhodospirillales bacterium]